MSIYKKIPNFLTLSNLLLGCLAIVYLFYDHIQIKAVAEGGLEESGYFDGRVVDITLHYGKMHIAALFILIAAVVDFFDGFVARLFQAVSEMGKQLDSLADMVTFGLVPGIILYYLTGLSFFGSPLAYQFGIWMFVPGFAFTLFAAWRLAKFNITSDHQTDHFIGLPVPAGAIFVAGLPLALFFNEGNTTGIITNTWFLYGSSIVLGLLMVSNMRMINLKVKKDNPKANRSTLIFLGLAFIIIIIGLVFLDLRFTLLPILVIFYILYSFIQNLIKT